MEFLGKLIQQFLDFAGKQPRAVQIVVVVFFMGIIGWVVFVLFPPKPPPPKTDFDSAYTQAANSLNPSDKDPAGLGRSIENLMHLAVTDKQRCDAGKLWLTVAQTLTNPPMPPSVNEFITLHGNDPSSCASILASAAKKTQTQVVAVEAKPSPAARPANATPAVHPTPHALLAVAAVGSAASQIVQAATSVGAQGWMYLGLATPDGAHLSTTRTIEQQALPKKDDKIVTRTSVNLRDMPDPRQTLGPVVGVIPKGSTVTVSDTPVAVTRALPRGATETLVWARVQLSAKAQVALATTAASPGPLVTPTPSAATLPPVVATASRTASGIDISHFQGSVDFAAAARGGADFAIIKATEGATNVDPAFVKNWSDAKAAGLVRGAYHLMRFGDPDAESRNFLAAVKLEAGDLPAAVDLELARTVTPKEAATKALRVLALVQQATGKKPIVYDSYAGFAALFAAEPALANYPLWIASYGDAPPRIPAPGTDWTFWQYSATGTVTGITGNVDLDRFNGSRDKLRAFAAAK